MIFISTPSFDLSGTLALEHTAGSDLTSQARRVTRTRTLDGGVSVADMGYAHGDRTIKVKAAGITRETYQRAAYLHQNYPLMLLSCAEGLFLGAIGSLRVDGDTLLINFLVKSKESS